MPITTLPNPIRAYLEGLNAQDIDAVTACFTADAVVRDEGQTHDGIAAVRAWATDVSDKYQPSIAVLDVPANGGGTVVACRVSGAFPSSPVELRFAFVLNGEKIARLEIS